MDIGPSTTNAALSEALADFLNRQGKTLTNEDYALIDEASTRIGENQDEDED